MNLLLANQFVRPSFGLHFSNAIAMSTQSWHKRAKKSLANSTRLGVGFAVFEVNDVSETGNKSCQAMSNFESKIEKVQCMEILVEKFRGRKKRVQQLCPKQTKI